MLRLDKHFQASGDKSNDNATKWELRILWKVSSLSWTKRVHSIEHYWKSGGCRTLKELVWDSSIIHNILGVTISGCGLSDPTLAQFLSIIKKTLNVLIDYNAVYDSIFAVTIAVSQNVGIKNTHVIKNTGFGLLAISLY